jgi:hypothetical protein
MEVFVIFINMTLREESTSPMGYKPHDIGVDSRCKHLAVKTDSKKRSLRVGRFVTSVYDVYFPGDHGHFGTDADHVPVIPGNDFTPDIGRAEGYQRQDPTSGMDIGPSPIDD